MTRARDELILCHAGDYGGTRARRVSPFVLEALDQPSIAIAPGAGAAVPAPLQRLAAFEAVVPPSEGARAPVTEPLMLSFGAIDAYLTCPAKYRYGHVLRIPVAPHHALVYGAAMHTAVQEFHRRHARGEIMSDEALAASFEAACTSEGFLTRDHEQARLAAGRDALRRFREDQLKPGAVIPSYVEREFTFSLGGDRIRGRWDRVDIETIEGDAIAGMAPAHAPAAGPGAGVAVLPDVVEDTLPLMPRERVTITDYKSSDVRDPAVARKRAREDRPPARCRPAVVPRLRGRRAGGARPQAVGQGSRSDRPGERGHPGEGLHGPPGPAGLWVLPVPGYLPVECDGVTWRP